MWKNKKAFVILFIFTLVLIISFFYYSTYKKSKMVNNIDKSNIKEYILNISSYEDEVIVIVNSNKNSNKYILKQKYDFESKKFIQTVIEPSNISGLTTIYDGNNLKIENTNINLSHIYEDYDYILGNALDLFSFIENFKKSPDSEYYETENEGVFKLINKNGNKYNYFQNLYINKETCLPVRMEIMDMNQKLVVYIVYNEINFNGVKKDDILAFSLEKNKIDL